ncbi:MAG TPA: hypothetical protein VF680_01300 [Allosphingosinicella sp.]
MNVLSPIAPTTAPAAENLQLVEWGGPELLDAGRAALVALRRQRDTLLEVGCIVIDGAPDLSSLEPDVQPEVAELDAAIAGIELAELKATTPLDDLTAAQQAAILTRFPPPMIKELPHG